MGQRNPHAAGKQDFKPPRGKRQDVADGKQRKQYQQQAAPFHMARQQHERQRSQRDNPCINRNHYACFGRRHAEALSDVAQKCDGDKFRRVEDERADCQGNDAQPGFV